jgi:predicted PilT family ATPase
MRAGMKMLVAVLAVALAATMMVPVALAGGTVRQIALNGSAAFPAANGKAVYKVDGGERELQIEVEDIRRLAGARVNVFVNGNKIGSPRVSNLGEARVERNTDAGQSVPRIANGSTVRVRTQGGTLIARGTF